MLSQTHFEMSVDRILTFVLFVGHAHYLWATPNAERSHFDLSVLIISHSLPYGKAILFHIENMVPRDQLFKDSSIAGLYVWSSRS